MIDWRAVEQAGIAAAAAAMTEGAQMIAGRAKEKAPVRKVFRGQEEAVRYGVKSIAEITGDRDLRRAAGLGPENEHILPPSVASKDAPRQMAWRRVTSPGHLASTVAQSRLSRRGRYEVRSGRSAHGGELGGRLRDEIYAEQAQIEGRHIRARVVSPTPYAIHQEIGNRHNAAHPYLRPAGHEGLDELRSGIARSVAGATRAALRGRYKVKITLKAVE